MKWWDCKEASGESRERGEAERRRHWGGKEALSRSKTRPTFVGVGTSKPICKILSPATNSTRHLYIQVSGIKFVVQRKKKCSASCWEEKVENFRPIENLRALFPPWESLYRFWGGMRQRVTTEPPRSAGRCWFPWKSTVENFIRFHLACSDGRQLHKFPELIAFQTYVNLTRVIHQLCWSEPQPHSTAVKQTTSGYLWYLI